MNPSQVKAFLEEQKAKASRPTSGRCRIHDRCNAGHAPTLCRIAARNGALRLPGRAAAYCAMTPGRRSRALRAALRCRDPRAAHEAVAAMEAVLDWARQVQPRLNCFLRIDETSARGRASRGPSACAWACTACRRRTRTCTTAAASFPPAARRSRASGPRRRPRRRRAGGADAGAVQFRVLNMTEFARAHGPQLALRPLLQPLECRAHPRRLLRRNRCFGRRPGQFCGPGLRHRRLDPLRRPFAAPPG